MPVGPIGITDGYQPHGQPILCVLWKGNGRPGDGDIGVLPKGPHPQDLDTYPTYQMSPDTSIRLDVL